MERNGKNDNVGIMISFFSTSSTKKKRSSSSDKNKAGHAAAKSIHFNDLRVYELNESNKHLLKQQKQVMLVRDRIKKPLKFILKNQKKIVEAMNQKKCLTS